MAIYTPPATLQDFVPIPWNVMDGEVPQDRLPDKNPLLFGPVQANSTLPNLPFQRDVVWYLFSPDPVTVTSPSFLPGTTTTENPTRGQFAILSNTGSNSITIATSSTVPSSTIKHSSSITIAASRSVLLCFSAGFWNLVGSPGSLPVFGTMAVQNSDALSATGGALTNITFSGGSINGTPIGALAPSTARFTSLNVTALTSTGTIARFGSPTANVTVSDNTSGLIGFYSSSNAVLSFGYNPATGQSQRVLIGQAGDNGSSYVQAPSAAFGTVYATSTAQAINPYTGALISSGGLGVGGDAQIAGAVVANHMVLRGNPFTFTLKVAGLSANHLKTIGPSAPTSPAIYDEWSEYTAAGKFIENWFWNGTRWCSTKVYSATYFNSSVSANSTNWFPSSHVPRAFASGLVVDRVEHHFYLNGAAITATNHWDAQILWGATNSVYSPLYPVTKFPDTLSNTKTFVTHAPTVAYIPFTDFITWRFNYVKVGVPGNLVIESTVHFRIAR